jgi:hypothetical protein
MSFRIHNKGIASGLAVSALVAEYQDQAGATELDSFVDVNSIQAFDVPRITAEVMADETNSARSTVVIEIPSEPVWEETSQSRFEELVEKIALEGELSRVEELEYRNLKALKQRTHPSRSFDEIVADHELHKKVAEAVNSLRTLIEYATSTFPTEAQTNRF